MSFATIRIKVYYTVLVQKKSYFFLSRSLDLSYRLFLVFHILKNYLQKEKILTDRLNRVVQLDHASKALEKQMDNHNNGVKVLDNQRLKSIKTRLNSYAAQINESSRTLSPQVCICAFKLFRHTTIILPLVSSCFLHTYSFFPTKGARRITVIGGKEN